MELQSRRDGNGNGNQETSKNSTWKGVVVIIGSLLIQFTLGSTYIFGNFSTYIVSYLRVNGISPGIVYSTSIWITGSGQISVGCLMFLAGSLEKRFGPRIATIIGSCLFSGSMMLSYFSIQSSFLWLVFTYGFLMHTGLSIGYPVSANCAMRWFPNNKGTAVGIVMGGFGFAAFIWNPLVTFYINPNNSSPNHKVGNEVYFSQPEILNKVPSCFLVLGSCYAVITFLGTLMTFNPKPSIDYVPAPQKEYSYEVDLDSSSESDADQTQNDDGLQLMKKSRKTGKSRTTEDFFLTPREVLKTQQFYLLWFILLIFNLSIDFIVFLYKAYGQTFIKNDNFLSMTGAFASLANACGRPMWGLISDKISIKKTMLILLLILAFLVSTLGFTEKGGKFLFAGYISCIYLTFSGMFSILPLITQNSFGTKYFITNYGLLFTVFIFNGLLGSFATIELQITLGWHAMFYLLGCVLLLAAMFTCFLKKPNPSSERNRKVTSKIKDSKE